MATMKLDIHPVDPQPSKIAKAAEAIQRGAVVLYPTDTGYALGCNLSDKDAIQRIRSIRKLSPDKPLTFLCDSLTHISEYAKVSNAAYKFIKRLIPGPYTFVLPATKLVPKFVQDPKRSTTGIRVPDNEVSKHLSAAMGTPLISISARDSSFVGTTDELLAKLLPVVDVAIVSDDYTFVGESTVLDLTSDVFSIIREGAGIEEVMAYMPEEAE